jgi:hypothetical protein
MPRAFFPFNCKTLSSPYNHNKESFTNDFSNGKNRYCQALERDRTMNACVEENSVRVMMPINPDQINPASL